MRRHWFALVAVVAAAMLLLSCGGSAPTSQGGPPPAGSGQVALMGTDAPICGIVSFEVTITEATLTPQGGGGPVTIIDSSNPVTVDFASLMGFNTLLNIASVPEGTYSQVSFTFMPSPQLTVLDGSTPTTIDATLTQTTVTANISPALTVSASGTSGLTLDFRLFQSIQTDSTGQVTGTVDPSIRVIPAVTTNINGPDDIDDLPGIVQSVSAASSNSKFTGSFTVRVRNRRNFLINVANSTKFEGVSGLSDLTKGLFVEIDARVDPDGNIVAQHVEAESETDATRAAFRGPILSVTRDANSNATQLMMFVRAEYPDVSSTVPLHSTITVNVSSGSVFRVATFGADLSAFFFNSTAIGRGQHVVVHGLFAGGTPSTVTANQIVLRPQPALGNALAMPAPVIGSDGKTGGYYLQPCNPLFQNQTINVLTFANTNFHGLTDLNGLTTSNVYLNRGFLLYTTNSGSVNGLSWTTPPSAYVFPAYVVQRLDLP